MQEMRHYKKNFLASFQQHADDPVPSPSQENNNDKENEPSSLEVQNGSVSFSISIVDTSEKPLSNADLFKDSGLPFTEHRESDLIGMSPPRETVELRMNLEMPEIEGEETDRGGVSPTEEISMEFIHLGSPRKENLSSPVDFQESPLTNGPFSIKNMKRKLPEDNDDVSCLPLAAKRPFMSHPQPKSASTSTYTPPQNLFLARSASNFSFSSHSPFASVGPHTGRPPATSTTQTSSQQLQIVDLPDLIVEQVNGDDEQNTNKTPVRKSTRIRVPKRSGSPQPHPSTSAQSAIVTVASDPDPDSESLHDRDSPSQGSPIFIITSFAASDEETSTSPIYVITSETPKVVQSQTRLFEYEENSNSLDVDDLPSPGGSSNDDSSQNPTPSPQPSTSGLRTRFGNNREETVTSRTQEEQLEFAEKKKRRADTLIPPDCPLTRAEIVDLPIDDFNELIEKHNFSEAQKALFRDYRRKGKNRVAARKSRERKICGIEQLKSNRIKKLERLKELEEEQEKLVAETALLKRAVDHIKHMPEGLQALVKVYTMENQNHRENGV